MSLKEFVSTSKLGEFSPLKRRLHEIRTCACGIAGITLGRLRSEQQGERDQNLPGPCQWFHSLGLALQAAHTLVITLQQLSSELKDFRE